MYPDYALLQTSGSFYGEAGGGPNSDGTVFSFAKGMGGTSPSNSGLSISPSSVQAGSNGPVVMTATVTPTSGSGTPTGVVGFFNGSNEVGSVDLSAGTATFNYNPSALAVNTYQMTATYSGDGTFAGSTSSPQTLTVTPVSVPQAATPSISPAGGTYNSAQTVTISDSTSGATIYYTNDGTTPTTGSAVYSAPLTVSSTETIEAMAAASGYTNSAVATATYTISSSPSYTVSVTPASLTIVAGQSGTATFTVTPTNGFNSQVSFSCTGLPSGASCSFNPSSVTPSSGNPATSTLTISTTAASAAVRMPAASSPVRPIYAFLLVPWMGFIFIAASGRQRSSLRTFSVLAVLAATALLLSCGSSSNTGGRYTSGD